MNTPTVLSRLPHFSLSSRAFSFFVSYKAHLAIVVLGLAATSLFAAPLDTVVFGDTRSESSHALVTSSTQVIMGALGEPARQPLPKSPVDVDGGEVTFTMAVDPVRRNYVSVKLWGGDGGDVAQGRLYLYLLQHGVDYQVGYRHQADYMPLSVNGYGTPLPGRFFYSTTLLPLSMTQGKTSIQLKLVAAGRLFPFGAGGPPKGNYQFSMDRPGRPVYRAYTHVDPFLDPAKEVQGSLPATMTPSSPGEEVLAPGGRFHDGVVNRINNRLNTPINVASFAAGDVEYLAHAYNVAALFSHHNPAVLGKVVALLDAFAQDFYANPSNAVHAGGNEGWGGRFGAFGGAIFQLKTALSPYLDHMQNYGAAGGSKTRRQAWADMLYASREYGRTNRNGWTLTNQNMIANDNIYKANLGMLLLDDARAFPDKYAQRYLLEACGLAPWLGSDLPTGNSAMRYGDNYHQTTSKGLTKEFGYVGANYGEMGVHVAEWYRLTGNVAFRDMAVKMVKARAPFRRPSITVDGTAHYRTMEAIGLLAWRGAAESDGEFASSVVYAEPNSDPSFAGHGLYIAAATHDPTVVGYAKQMMADNQYFYTLNGDGRYYTSPYVLDAFADYQTVKALPDSGVRLPMTPGQPDVAWADEDNAIVALKRGNDCLWIEPYWQALLGVNGLARFHYSTPAYDQYGVLETSPQFVSDGSYSLRASDRIDGLDHTAYRPPNPPQQAYAGERLLHALSPATASDSAPFVGRASFYAFRFGRFLFGLNASASRSYTLNPPSGFTAGTDLVSGATVSGNISVAPHSTVVIDLGSANNPAPAPVAPLFVTASGSVQQITVSWSAASGATSYALKRAANLGGPYTTVATGIKASSYVDKTVTAQASYTYVVTGLNANGESYPSAEVSTSAGLPSPWQGQDIGPVGTPGSASEGNGAFHVSGSGSDIGGVKDSGYFTYLAVSGDQVITARLTGPVDGKVGLAMRQSLDVGAAEVALLHDEQIRTATRTGANANAAWASFGNSPMPQWLRITRTGNTFTSAQSVDGSTWITLETHTVPMAGTYYVGLLVCARAADLKVATFDHVAVQQP